jgi:hypothetical protein
LSTHSQTQSLLDDLKGAKDNVSWQIGKVINALLEKGKEEHPDNVALAVLDPLTPGPSDKYISGMDAADVRAIVGQIAAATKPPPYVG